MNIGLKWVKVTKTVVVKSVKLKDTCIKYVLLTFNLSQTLIRMLNIDQSSIFKISFKPFTISNNNLRKLIKTNHKRRKIQEGK